MVRKGMFEIRKVFRFESAHQLSHAVTKACYETIHGHSYKVEMFFQDFVLNEDEMVLDFGAMGNVKEFIETLDHSLMIPQSFDSLYIAALQKWNKKVIVVERNPTAEYLARYIYGSVHNMIPRLARVRVHETETGYAEYPVSWVYNDVTEHNLPHTIKTGEGILSKG